MLTSFGTLFALTPTGSQLFKDGKVQRIAPASEGGGSVTVNPVADEELRQLNTTKVYSFALTGKTDATDPLKRRAEQGLDKNRTG